MKKHRINKFSERKFITKSTLNYIQTAISSIKEKAIKDGLINNSSTLWDELNNVFIEELGEMALKIRKETINNY